MFVGRTTGDAGHGLVYWTGYVDGCSGYGFEFGVLAWDINLGGIRYKSGGYCNIPLSTVATIFPMNATTL